MRLVEQMSAIQEQDIKAAICKAAGKKTITHFFEVQEAMTSWDLYIWDKRNISLQGQLIDNLRTAEQKIKKLDRSPN